MTDAEEPLRVIGVPRLDPEESPELYAELYRIARRIRQSERARLGLLPISPTVAVPPLAVEVGLALADACEGAVLIVDGNTRWPALQRVASAQDEVSRRTGFCTTWLADFVALATPPAADPSDSMRLEGLDRLLREETEGFIHILVDLTGFEQAGELWGMFDALDGVLLVGHPGLTREHDLLRLHGEIPRGKDLGVLLIGR